MTPETEKTVDRNSRPAQTGTGPLLSRRLQAVAALVTPGSLLADIGTDHAYVPASLVMRGIVPGALAMDVGKGPLERAAQTVERYGLGDKITTRISDGLQKLQPGEADSIVIAGMGGALTVRILSDQDMRTLRRIAPKELILQPQSELAAVRSFLRKNGWHIAAENMVLEDGKYYPMMQVHPAGDHRDERGDLSDRTKMEDLYGPCLLADAHPVLLQYLQWEYEVFRRIAGQLEDADGEAALERKKELAEKMRLNLLARETVVSNSSRR